MSNVVTRIAPSPTGDMHIGTARTALFNWLYARGRNGKFLLRIEDTDKNRSTDAAQDAILDGMKWLGLDFDGEPISQSKRAPRHVEIANKLLETGKAYKCFLTETEIDDLRNLAINGQNEYLITSSIKLPYLTITSPPRGRAPTLECFQGEGSCPSLNESEDRFDFGL